MLYIGTDDGIYRWFSGANWPIFHSLQGKGVVGLASPGSGVLVALDSASTVWESRNNGIDWRSIPLPDGAGRPTSLALLDGAEIVVATARPLGLYRRPIGLPSESDAPRAMDRARRIEDRLIGRAQGLVSRFRKGESGGTATMEPPKTRQFGWTSLAVPSAQAGHVPPSVRLLTGHEGLAYAAIAGAGLWKSADLGASWGRVEGLPDEVYAVRFAPGTMAVGTSDGVKISADGGQTWADSSGGLEKVRQVRALEIKPTDPKVMLAGCAPAGAGEGPVPDRPGMGFALYESKDAGKTWKHLVRGFPEVLESDSIADIRYMPDDADRAAVALASGEMWNTYTDGLWWEPLARQIRGARVLSAAP
jgi:photosystem II stability/assembly factor-like uncharacterized protein